MTIPKDLIALLKKSKSIVILTGAGISAESGIKTFRDDDGLWAKFSPMELASIDGFMANPQLVWEWYQMRVDIVKNTQPNPGHYAITDLQNIYPNLHIITQNVDRLHQRAGNKNVIEIHGNIVTNRCFSCGNDYNSEVNLENSTIPSCPKCGGKIRPNVVWFGEMLPENEINKAENLSSKCDVFFSIGTSSVVYPAAGLPYRAKSNGAIIVEINTQETELTPYTDFALQGKAGEILPKLIEELKQ